MEGLRLPLRGLVLAMGTAAYLAVFGIEARILLSRGHFLLFGVTVLAFVDSTLAVRQHLFARMARGVMVESGAGRRLETPKPATPSVQAAVRARAAALGVSPPARVLRLPGTFNVVAAYVYGAASAPSLVVTGGAEALLLRRRSAEATLFQVLVDHELGHIAGEDSGWLYLARGIVWTTLTLLPFKVVALLAVLQTSLGRGYTLLFPSARSEVSTAVGFVLGEALSTSTVAGVILAYTALLLLLLASLHIVVVRRREYGADAFALGHMETSQGVAALKSLLSAAPPWAPMHSFAGAGWWHPPVQARLARARRLRDRRADLFIPALTLELLVLMSFRLVFGSSFGATGSVLNPEVEGALSCAYALVFAYLSASMFSGLTRTEVAVRMAWVVTVGGAIALVVIGGWWLIDARSGVGGPSALLLEVERLEVRLLLASFPVCAAIHALSAWLVSVSPVTARIPTPIGRSAVAAVLATGCLSLMSVPGTAALITFRAEHDREYQYVASLAPPDMFGNTSQGPLPDMLRAAHHGGLLDTDVPRVPLGFVLLGDRPFDGRIAQGGK